MRRLTPGFTGSPIRRAADHPKEDPAVLAELRASPAARFLKLDGLDPVPSETGGLSWATLDQAPEGSELLLLGLIEGEPRFVPLTPAPPAATHRSPALWQMLDTLPYPEAATYAAARSLIDWHGRHGFCAVCGTPTMLIRAGWARQCGNCGAEHFPRTDPVVIMLAEHQDRVLVGRQPRFPAGRYSALAGFVEVGESIEEAVARELKEEAGVTATSVRFVGSQPWPFPSQLMMAAIAPVESDSLSLDQDELEDAMWVTREEVAAALDEREVARFLPPPHYAIANFLFRRWLDGA